MSTMGLQELRERVLARQAEELASVDAVIALARGLDGVVSVSLSREPEILQKATKGTKGKGPKRRDNSEDAKTRRTDCIPKSKAARSQEILRAVALLGPRFSTGELGDALGVKNPTTSLYGALKRGYVRRAGRGEWERTESFPKDVSGKAETAPAAVRPGGLLPQETVTGTTGEIKGKLAFALRQRDMCRERGMTEAADKWQEKINAYGEALEGMGRGK